MTCRTLLISFLVGYDVNLYLQRLTIQVKNEALDYSDSDTSNGELNYYHDEGYDWDTDDEVEEANAADDMIKIIEGDW